MARNKNTQPNIDNSNPTAYPNGRIKDNDGSGNGTAVNESVYGDQHETFAKLMRLYGIPYNGTPDNEINGYQYIAALRALASKNDFILSITASAGKLVVPIKLGAMLPDEQVVCKAGINQAAETQIIGADGITRPLSSIGTFKSGEYVRLINTSTSVVLVRLVDSVNLDDAVNELAFLKAATLAEEIAGTSNTVATTPETNALAFVERVNGAESNGALAIAGVRNGLLSKEGATALETFTDPTSLIKITSGAGISTSAPSGGQKQSNFNFNYLDVFPPTGKTMEDLQGFTASIAEVYYSGDVNGDDTIWCNWQADTVKVRIICQNSEHRALSKVNWLAIWI